MTRLRAIVAALPLLTACSDAAAPDDGSHSPAPPAFEAPRFIFTADVNGKSQLFRFDSSATTRFVTSAGNDAQARSAAGLVVFSSDRDGNEEIYLTDADATTEQRVTNDLAADGEPALSPAGDLITFVRNATGTPRIFTVPAPVLADGGAAEGVVGGVVGGVAGGVVGGAAGGYAESGPLETGSAGLVPERSPAWSPDGERIAFTSTRTGISQVYVVSAAGGSARQLTHEAGGAFAPAWSDDGKFLVYAATNGTIALKRITVDGDDTASEVAVDALGIGQPSCALEVCVAVTDPLGDGGKLVILTPDGRHSRTVLDRREREREPAMIVR